MFVTEPINFRTLSRSLYSCVFKAGNGFLPYQEFKKIGLQGVDFEKTLSTWHYAGTAGLVYQSPLGPISLSYNLYDEARKKHGVLLHIGYLIYNKRSLE